MQNLVQLTQPYSVGYLHVQGAGGNTSVKSDGLMYIKSSGCFFSDIDEQNGYSILQMNKVSKDTSWESFVSNARRPSMEYGFHLLLDKYVLHTHSAEFNVLLCSQEGETFFTDIFTDAMQVPYLTPGQDLADYIAKHDVKPVFILFKNHGVVVHHNELKHVHEIYQQGIETIKRCYHIEEPRLKVELLKDETIVHYDEEPVEEWLSNYLIPDQAIFMHNKWSANVQSKLPITIDVEHKKITIKGSAREQKSIVDMIQWVWFVRSNQQQNGLSPQFLTSKNVEALFNLDSEKYRQQQLAKK